MLMRTAVIWLLVGAVASAPSMRAQAKDLSTMRIGELEFLAVRGDAEAQFRLGQIYQTGDGIQKNAELAAKWSLLAAENFRTRTGLQPHDTAKQVSTSLSRAFDLEKAYKWHEAKAAYLETLQIKSDCIEAKEGLARAETVLRALIRYEKNIDAAETLAREADFQKAIRRFNEAMADKPSHIVNSERVQSLHSLLMSQNNPVDVPIKSDGKTWVSIQHFRAPEKFDTKIIRMLPGNYLLQGRRQGFSDVDVLVEIRNGVNPPVIKVECSISFGAAGKYDEKADEASQQRAYQISLAQKGAEEAKSKSDFEEELQRLAPLTNSPTRLKPDQIERKTKVRQLIETAQDLAKKGEFQGAIRFFREAVLTKQGADYIGHESEILALQAQLLGQNQPVEVTIKSDGKTAVAVINFSQPSKDKTTKIKIMPGDYVITGSREGYQTVNVLARVRNGTPPPTFTLICNEREFAAER